MITTLRSGIHLPKLGYTLFPKNRSVGGKLRQNDVEGLLDAPLKKSYPDVCGISIFIIVSLSGVFVRICSASDVHKIMRIQPISPFSVW